MSLYNRFFVVVVKKIFASVGLNSIILNNPTSGFFCRGKICVSTRCLGLPTVISGNVKARERLEREADFSFHSSSMRKHIIWGINCGGRGGNLMNYFTFQHDE